MLVAKKVEIRRVYMFRKVQEEKLSRVAHEPLPKSELRKGQAPRISVRELCERLKSMLQLLSTALRRFVAAAESGGKTGKVMLVAKRKSLSESE